MGTVGLKAIHTFDNDTGPDDANHAEEGHFHPGRPGRSLPDRAGNGGQLMDIAPTLLELFGLEVPADMQGQAFPIDTLGSFI